jgi:hypothetical protein
MYGIRAALQSSRNQNNCLVELSSLKHNGAKHVPRLEVTRIHSQDRLVQARGLIEVTPLVKRKSSLHELACVVSIRSRGRRLLWNHFPIVMPTWIGTKYTCSAQADRQPRHGAC